MINTSKLRKKVDGLLADYRYQVRQVRQEQESLMDAKRQVSRVEAAQKIVQGIAETIQEQAHQQIASIVTRCLEAVFGPEAYEFKIAFEQKRGKTEARLLFVRDGMEIDPLFAAGGGVIDVAAFALRLACLLLARPQPRKLLVLDEPMKMLSADYHQPMRELLMRLSKELGVQIIMVTHASGLRIGKVIEL